MSWNFAEKIVLINCSYVSSFSILIQIICYQKMQNSKIYEDHSEYLKSFHIFLHFMKLLN